MELAIGSEHTRATPGSDEHLTRMGMPKRTIFSNERRFLVVAESFATLMRSRSAMKRNMYVHKNRGSGKVPLIELLLI